MTVPVADSAGGVRAAGRAPTAPAGVVEFDSVVKRFGDTVVLAELSFSLPKGLIIGLIGPSGCGKTTAVRMITGGLRPSGGAVRVFGMEPEQFGTKERARLGYTPQGFCLYPTLTVHENARFVAGLYGVSWFKRNRRIRELLEFLELWPARRRLARDLSGGMQRRLSLACALIHRPELLIVDEPTAGLDPVLRERIWEYLRSLREQGVTILVTTQYIDEARYCDQVAIMNRGRLVAMDAPDDLRRQVLGGDTIDIEVDRLMRDDIAELWQNDCVVKVDRTGPVSLRVTVDEAATAGPVITQVLRGRGANVVAVQPYVPTFDDVFMALVNDDGRKPDTHA